MSLDLLPLDAGDFLPPHEHVDLDVLAVPADEQPVVFDEDAYDRDER